MAMVGWTHRRSNRPMVNCQRAQSRDGASPNGASPNGASPNVAHGA
jgi:hypothetical protein